MEETKKKIRRKEEYIPLNQNMIDSMNENLKLRRSKTTSNKNTLVELMNLSIS